MFCGKNARLLAEAPNVFEDDRGQPLFEISDEPATLRMRFTDLSGSKINHIYLGELLDHPGLFENYPGLGDMPIGLYPFPRDGLYAEYLPPDERSADFKYGAAAVYNARSGLDLKSRLLHEVQHAVQVADFQTTEDRDWFFGRYFNDRASYRRPEEPTPTLIDQNGFISTMEKNLLTAKHELGRFLSDTQDDPKIAQAFKAVSADRQGIYYTKGHPNLPYRIVSVIFYGNMLDNHLDPLVDLCNETSEGASFMFLDLARFMSQSVDFYMPREEMARETQRRMFLTEEERTRSRPLCAASWDPRLDVAQKKTARSPSTIRHSPHHARSRARALAR